MKCSVVELAFKLCSLRAAMHLGVGYHLHSCSKCAPCIFDEASFVDIWEEINKISALMAEKIHFVLMQAVDIFPTLLLPLKRFFYPPLT